MKQIIISAIILAANGIMAAVIIKNHRKTMKEYRAKIEDIKGTVKAELKKTPMYRLNEMLREKFYRPIKREIQEEIHSRN